MQALQAQGFTKIHKNLRLLKENNGDYDIVITLLTSKQASKNEKLDQLIKESQFEA